MKTVQQTLSGEMVTFQHASCPFSIKDMIWLPIKYFISVANPQQWLFLLSFLTYGVGDGITAVYMIEKAGILREVNPVMRFLYTSYGAHGLIGLKIWFAMVILFMVWIVSKRENTYWKITGFLTALTIGGSMAMFANLMVASNLGSLPSGSIIVAYLALIVLLVMVGDLIDNHDRFGSPISD